jgi:hypothetical protein
MLHVTLNPSCIAFHKYSSKIKFGTGSYINRRLNNNSNWMTKSTRFIYTQDFYLIIKLFENSAMTTRISQCNFYANTNYEVRCLEYQFDSTFDRREIRYVTNDLPGTDLSCSDSSILDILWHGILLPTSPAVMALFLISSGMGYSYLLVLQWWLCSWYPLAWDTLTY